MALPRNQVPNFVNTAGMAFKGSLIDSKATTDAAGATIVKESATYNYENTQYKVTVTIEEK
jgi:hypothetical protein